HGRRQDTGNSPFHSQRPDIGDWRFNFWIDASDIEVGTHLTSRCIKTSLESRVDKSERRRARVALDKDRCVRCCCSATDESRRDQSWRIAAEFFLNVRRGQPVVVDAKSAAHGPVAVSLGIPCEANARAPQV